MNTIFTIQDEKDFEKIALETFHYQYENIEVYRKFVDFLGKKREDILKMLKENNYHSYATYLDKNSLHYNKVEIKSKNAIILGNEAKGVGKDFLRIADTKTIIPILGNAESLNVAVASALILYKFRELQNYF